VIIILFSIVALLSGKLLVVTALSLHISSPRTPQP
jgi:hypothetical protein